MTKYKAMNFFSSLVLLSLKHWLMRIIYSLFFLFTSICLFAQEETKTHHEEIGFFEEEKFVSVYDLVFQTFEESQSLIKYSGGDRLFNREVLDYSERNAFYTIGELAYERKLGPSFSINNKVLFANFRYNFGGSIGVEPRWYYNMKKKIASGKSSNNLSGNFIGADFEYGQYFGDDQSTSKIKKLGLKYGIQRRIFGRGFINIRVGPEYYLEKFKRGSDGNSTSFKSKTFGFSTQIKMGFILGQPKLGLKAAQKCDVFQCFEERKHMFKIDFLNLLNITKIELYQHISGSLAFSFEQKMGTVFSLNNELALVYRYIRNEFSSVTMNHFEDFSYGLRLKSELRYYYNLKKKIAEGKSANNLSGSYFGVRIRTGDLLEYSSNEELRKPSIRKRENLTFSLITGVQKTLFKRVYVDYVFGVNILKYDLKKGKVIEPIYNPSERKGHRLFLGLVSNLRIGIRF